MEVDSLPYEFPWKLVEASMEVHGSFHCRWKWKLPLLPSIAASTNIFRGNFHDLPYTPTYFHLLPRVSQTSSCSFKSNSTLNATLTPTPSLSYLHGIRPTSNYHGRRWKQFVVSMETVATCVEAGLLPTCIQVGGSVRGVDIIG